MSAALTVAVIAAAALIDGARVDARSAAAAPPPARIRSGRATSDFPAVGALSLDGDFCTGTLIGCRTVLTAGHCVCLNGAPSCAASAAVAPEQIHLFLQHGGFAQASAVDASILGLDLAVVTLAEPITGIVPAELKRSRPALDAAARIAGFGTNGFLDSIPQGVGIKRTGSVELSRSCGDPRFDLIYLCANAVDAGDAATCSGDSGGPLLTDTGAGHVVAAVAKSVAGGDAAHCIPPFTALFTDVSPWRAEINAAAQGDVNSTACGDLPAVGTADVTVHPFAGDLTSSIDEVGGKFEVPPGIAVLRVTMNGALVTGAERNNFDLYVEHVGECGAICSDTRDSAFGACEIAEPATGTWRVRAHSVQGTGEVQVTATLFGAANAGDGAAGTQPPPRMTERLTSAGHPAVEELVVLRQRGASAECIGDCDGCGSVSIGEVVRMVNIALGTIPASACSMNQSGVPVTIGVLIQVVRDALDGCPPA